MTGGQEHEARKMAEEDAYAAWLAGLAVGDEVALASKSRDLYNEPYSLFTVERLTATQLVTSSGLRVRRKDGIPQGGSYFRRIEPVTEQLRGKLAEWKLRRWVKFDAADQLAKLNPQDVAKVWTLVQELVAKV